MMILGEKSEMKIWADNTAQELWGYVFKPSDVESLMCSEFMGIDTKLSMRKINEMMKLGGYTSTSDFVLDAEKEGLLSFAVPKYSAENGLNYFDKLPKYLWCEVFDKIFKSPGKQDFIHLKTAGGDRFIPVGDGTVKDVSYCPAPLHRSAGALCFQTDDEMKTLVTKEFDGMLMAKVMDNGEFADFAKIPSHYKGKRVREACEIR